MNTTNDKKPSSSGATGVVRGLTKCQSGPTKGSDTPVATMDTWEGAPRGIRNCNPLNIRRVAGQVWRGQVLVQEDPAFVQFESMEWGLRAAFHLYRVYDRRYQAHSVVDIVRRWAPPNENNTQRYIDNVCKWTGFGGHQVLIDADWLLLVQAMARQETGIILDAATILRAYRLYRKYL